MAIIHTGGSVVAQAAPLISGAVAANARSITVTDTGTIASGYNRALYINYTSSGVKTGSAEVNALGVDLTVSGDISGYAYAQSIYTAISGNPAIGMLAGLSMYCDNIGSATISSHHALDIGMDATNLATRHAFARFYVAAGTIRECFIFQGSATDFFRFVASDSCGCSSSGTAGSVTHKIQCNVGGATGYLHMYDS